MEISEHLRKVCERLSEDFDYVTKKGRGLIYKIYIAAVLGLSTIIKSSSRGSTSD